MKFASIRDLRVKPGEVWKALEKDDVVLTSNGKPFAVLTRTDGESLETLLSTLRRSRAQAALGEIRRTAREKGLDTVSAAAITGEIKAYRATRRRKRHRHEKGR
jgi:hypothetical protein